MNKQECLQLLKRFEGSSFIEHCGIKLEDADCGWVKSSMPVTGKITNPFGYIHGGAIATLMDTTGGIVCWTVGCTVCTLDLDTNFMKNVKVGRTVFAEARILRKTEHVIFVEVQVYSDENEMLSKGKVTMYITGTYDKIPPKW